MTNTSNQRSIVANLTHYSRVGWNILIPDPAISDWCNLLSLLYYSLIDSVMLVSSDLILKVEMGSGNLISHMEDIPRLQLHPQDVEVLLEAYLTYYRDKEWKEITHVIFEIQDSKGFYNNIAFLAEKAAKVKIMPSWEAEQVAVEQASKYFNEVIGQIDATELADTVILDLELWAGVDDKEYPEPIIYNPETSGTICDWIRHVLVQENITRRCYIEFQHYKLRLAYRGAMAYIQFDEMYSWVDRLWQEIHSAYDIEVHSFHIVSGDLTKNINITGTRVDNTWEASAEVTYLSSPENSTSK